MFTCKIDKNSELRLIEPYDAEELSELIHDSFDHISEWSAWLTQRERPVESTREWIKYNRSRMGAGDGYEMAISCEGKIAGQIGYNYFDIANRRTEIGYWLGEGFQGRGLVTRAVAALIDNAFDNLSMNRVEIRCGAENYKSRKVPERLGFREEGVARQCELLHGKFIDLVVYAMLAEEWNGVKLPVDGKASRR